MAIEYISKEVEKLKKKIREHCPFPTMPGDGHLSCFI